MVITMVSKRFVPWYGPRPGIVGELLPMVFAESPRSCERAATHGVHEVTNRCGPFWMSVLKEGWIVMPHSKSHIARLRLGLTGL